MTYIDDTIVAAATPPGVGGVAIVRVSGHDVERVAERMLGRVPQSHRATVCDFSDGSGTVIDRGLALYFAGPQSFTGESVLEFHAHGGPMIVGSLLDAVVALGARRAEPGEFSKRAYLNGKLDLVQAEAIADLISAGTRQAAQAALRSLSGAFSMAVADLDASLTNLRLHVEAAIDFPEEEIDFLSDRALEERIRACRNQFAQLSTSAERGRVLSDGCQIVIAGEPNVGKSSLLNALAGQDAAIVTPHAGTTRDVLRERVNLDGLAVEFVDTAGLREDAESIEAEGIRRAQTALQEADVALWVLDAAGDDRSDNNNSDRAAPASLADLPTLIVRNKIDLTDDTPGISAGNESTINLSAKTGAGIDSLIAAIKALAGYSETHEGAFSARRRHLEALARAEQHFREGVRALEQERAGELFAEELKLARQALGSITGELSSDDLLGKIFAEFCIGK
ncbi:MAG: tRNA uridine-5-carboxymethylaminomethyl(34) synthesis GTPase MnmE [Pseudomonadota bacterium]